MAQSTDGSTWNMLQDSSGADIVFPGNINDEDSHKNDLPQPIITRYLRLIVVSFQSWIAIRWELEGCPLGG